MSSYQQAREALGAYLRELRKQAGFNGKRFAERLGWPASKISKIEHGRQLPTETDLTAWATAAGQPHAAEELTARLRALETHYATWRRQLGAGIRPRQLASLDLEAETRTLRAFEAAVVPGLLQTAEYARHILAGVVELYGTPDDVAEGVRVRMQRQQALYDLAKRYHFVLTEAAVRNRVCPLPVLRGQIDRLLATSSLDNLTLGVIPWEADLPFAPNHGFWIFDQRLVLVETFGAELSLTDPSEIRLYTRVFEQLAARARYGEQARAILARVLADLTG